jgi:hypothetical protein
MAKEGNNKQIIIRKFLIQPPVIPYPGKIELFDTSGATDLAPRSYTKFLTTIAHLFTDYPKSNVSQ